MKVKELIRKLNNYNQDMEIKIGIRKETYFNYQPRFTVDSIELTNFDSDSTNEVELIIGYKYVKDFILEVEAKE